MFVRIVIGALLAGVLMMIFGFVFWVFSPFSAMMMDPLPNEAALAAALDEHVEESGVYVYPYPPSPDVEQAEFDAFTEKHEAGPIVQMFFIRDGGPPMPPSLYAIGYLHFVSSAVLAGCLLAIAAPALPSYGSRVVFVTLLGLFAAYAMNISQPIWFNHPWRYWLLMTGYDTVNWLLAGLALALFVKAPRGDSGAKPATADA